MQHLMTFVFGFCLTAATVPAETTAADAKTRDGLAILRKAEAAIKKVDRVTYKADVTATGWVKPFVRSAQGTVVLGQQSKWEIERFRCDVTIEDPDSDKALAFTAGSDGDLYFLVDAAVKTAYEDMDPMVLGSHSRHIQRVVMKALVAPHPFGEKLDPESVEVTGTEMIGAEPCHEVRIKSEEPPDQYWCISQKDFLPRRVRRVYPNRDDPKGEEGTTVLSLTDLVVNPNLATDPFKLVVPKGFQKTDDFAP